MATKGNIIKSAIQHQKTMDFYYLDKDGKSGQRVKAQVMAMGVSKKGNMVVRAWVKPPSVSASGLKSKGDWRMFKVKNMKNLKLKPNKWSTLKPGFNPLGDDSMRKVIHQWKPRVDGKLIDLRNLSLSQLREIANRIDD